MTCVSGLVNDAQDVHARDGSSIFWLSGRIVEVSRDGDIQGPDASPPCDTTWLEEDCATHGSHALQSPQL